MNLRASECVRAAHPTLSANRHGLVARFARAVLSLVLALVLAACNKASAPIPSADFTPKSAEQIWTEVSPSLIYVAAQGFDGSTMQGSGFIVELEGKRVILTNRHVVKGAEKVMVGTDAENLLPSSFYKIASDLDLAVANCPDSLKAPPLPLAVRPLNPGVEVTALGFPLGLNKVITRGVVSSVEETYVLFDAPISSGNSGGPVMNQFGEVVGVATMGSNNRGDAIVQNLNLAIRVTAIPKLGLFADPLLRISDVAARIREVETFIEKGYRENDFLILQQVLLFHWVTRDNSTTKAIDLQKAQDAQQEVAALQRKIEGRHGSLRKAVIHYVAFLKQCEAQVDALPAAFAGLGSDTVLRDFLKDERKGGWVRVNATPELLPTLARISADHWLASIEDHRFRLEWALHYSPDIPMGPPFAEMDRFNSDRSERPTIRLQHAITNESSTDLKNYCETIKQWASRLDVIKDSGKQIQKDGSAERDPIKAETLHGDLFGLVSSFRQYLSLEAAEKENFNAAITLLRADIGNRPNSCWSGALLAQHLVYAGRFDEAWVAYEKYFSGPPPFDAFNLKQGWSDGGASVALFHICEGMNTDGPGFRQQFGRYPSVIANAKKWNELVKTVDGRRLKGIDSLSTTLSSQWFQSLSRFARLRVLAYFRYVRPDEQRIAHYQKHGQFPPLDPLKEIEDFEKALDGSPKGQELWNEISERQSVNALF